MCNQFKPMEKDKKMTLESAVKIACNTLIEKMAKDGNKTSVTIGKIMTKSVVENMRSAGYRVTVKHDKYSDGVYIYSN